MDPGFLSAHGGLNPPPPLLSARYSLGGRIEREGCGGAGSSFPCGDPAGGGPPPPSLPPPPPPPPPPSAAAAAYFHYFSTSMPPDIGPAYNMAGGTGGVEGGGLGALPLGGGAGVGGEFMTSSGLHPVALTSTFTSPPPPRLQLAPGTGSRGGGNGEATSPPPPTQSCGGDGGGMESGGGESGSASVYTLVETSSKSSK
ncbi:hypothetical protein ACOMHN_030308 [Nucella lapillus]